MSSPSKGEDDSYSRVSAATLKKRRLRASTDKASISTIREDAQDTNLNKICKHLEGDPSLQMLVLHMLQKGALQHTAKGTVAEKSVATSSSKFQLLSIENWAASLHDFSPLRFNRGILMKLSKAHLCQIGCFTGCLEPGPAIASRSLKCITSLMLTRSIDMFKSRRPKVDINELGKHCWSDENQKKINVQHDWTKAGVFEIKMPIQSEVDREIDKSKALILHISSGKSTALPPELYGLEAHDNYLVTLAVFKTKLADVLVIRVFESAQAVLPKPFWLKRIPGSRLAPSPDGKGSDLEEAGASLLSFQQPMAPLQNAGSPKAPDGTGNSEPKGLTFLQPPMEAYVHMCLLVALGCVFAC